MRMASTKYNFSTAILSIVIKEIKASNLSFRLLEKLDYKSSLGQVGILPIQIFPRLVQVAQGSLKTGFLGYPHVPLPVPIHQIKIKNKGFQNPETLARLVPRAGIEPAHHLSDTGF